MADREIAPNRSYGVKPTGGGSTRGVQDSSGITSSIYLRWFRAVRVRARDLLLVIIGFGYANYYATKN